MNSTTITLINVSFTSQILSEVETEQQDLTDVFGLDRESFMQALIPYSKEIYRMIKRVGIRPLQLDRKDFYGSLATFFVDAAIREKQYLSDSDSCMPEIDEFQLDIARCLDSYMPSLPVSLNESVK